MSVTNDITYGRLSLHFLLDWQHGSDILNLTRLLYDFGQVTPDYANPIPGKTETVGEHRLAGFQVVSRTTSKVPPSSSCERSRSPTISRPRLCTACGREPDMAA